MKITHTLSPPSQLKLVVSLLLHRLDLQQFLAHYLRMAISCLQLKLQGLN